MKRLVPIVLLLAVAAAVFFLTKGGGATGPNVILVTLDTARADYMSAYGSTRVATPNFDSIGAEGARFELAMSSSAVTPVSHATILTGKYQYNHGLRVLSSAGKGFRLPKDQVTLATRLKEEGYSTAAVHSAFPVSSFFGFARDFDVFKSMDGLISLTSENASWDTSKLQRRSDETTAIVLETIDGLPEPWFLWIHYWDVHDVGLLPPDEYLEGIPVEGGEIVAPTDPLEVLALQEEIYAREYAFLDFQFGELLNGLRGRGVYDRTLVAITSDHGEGLLDGVRDHGWKAHRMVYQEQLHVPLLIKGPGIPAGRVVESMVPTADLAPTITDYLGLGHDALGSIDGRSLRELIDSGTGGPRFVYADQVNGYDLNASMWKNRPAAKFLYCVSDGERKLTYRPHMPNQSELFHLPEDPDEVHNRLGEEPAVVQRLMAELARRQPWVLSAFEADASVFDEGGASQAAFQAALEGSGYLGGDGDPEPGSAWQWMCPAHPDRRIAGNRAGRCEECEAITVPVQ